MSVNSKIEWTDTTWNPVRGCTKVSAGCKHCYAETLSERFRGVPGHPFEFGFDLQLAPHKLAEPFKWTKPQMVFVNSMSDLFHEDIPDAYIQQVVDVMAAANWHIYQVLTKRANRMRQLLLTKLSFAAKMNHIWWGTSVENKKSGFPRIQQLRDSNADMKFLSIEPLLEDLGKIDLRAIQWVIVGGESGLGARPMEVSWVTSIRDQCKLQNVPFFFKQWGGVRKSKNGRELEGKIYQEFPQFKLGEIPSVRIRRQIEVSQEVSQSPPPLSATIAH